MYDSVDAERALIGSIIWYQQDRFADVLAIVPDSQFFLDPQLAIAFAAISRLFHNNIPLEPPAISQEMNSMGCPGSATFLSGLTDESTLSHQSLIHYATKVAEGHSLRKLKAMGERIAKAAVAADAKPDQITAEIESEMGGLVGSSHIEVIAASDMADRLLFDSVESAQSADEGNCLWTRLPGLNGLTGGLRPGHVIVVGGMPSMGKSSFAVDALLFNVLQEKRALYVTLDEPSEDIVTRAVINSTAIDRAKLTAGGPWSAEELALLGEAREQIRSQNWFVVDKPDLTVLDIRSIARTQKRRGGLDLLVIDYIGQIRSHRRFESRNLELTEISAAIKAMAKELGIPVMVVSQLNREHNKAECNPDRNIWPRPRNSWLRDSGSIEQDANVIIFPFIKYEILRERFGAEHPYTLRERKKNGVDWMVDAEIIVSKNKMGPKGVVSCKFDQRRMCFVPGPALVNGEASNV